MRVLACCWLLLAACLLLALLFSRHCSFLAVGTALCSPAVGTALFSLLLTVDHPITLFSGFGHPSGQLLSVLLRAVHHALRDVPVHCTLLHVLRVVCWTDQHHCSLPPRAAREGLTFELSRSGFVSTSFSCSGGQPEHEHDHVSRVLLRPLGCAPTEALRVAVVTALAMCLMVSGHFSAQTRSFSSTCQHVWWSLTLVINASSALVPHGPLTVFRREPHRGVFPPRSLGTVLSITRRDLD